MSRLPAVTPRQMVAALKRAGFVEDRQQGTSHAQLFNPLTGRKTSVAMHARDLKRGTMMGILREAGISREQFRKLL